VSHHVPLKLVVYAAVLVILGYRPIAGQKPRVIFEE